MNSLVANERANLSLCFAQWGLQYLHFELGWHRPVMYGSKLDGDGYVMAGAMAPSNCYGRGESSFWNRLFFGLPLPPPPSSSSGSGLPASFQLDHIGEFEQLFRTVRTAGPKVRAAHRCDQTVSGVSQQLTHVGRKVPLGWADCHRQ